MKKFKTILSSQRYKKYDIDKWIFLRHIYPYFDQNHRKSGPAVIYDNGTLFWFSKGKNHRIDGPSIIIKLKIFTTKEWWFENKFCKKESIYWNK